MYPGDNIKLVIFISNMDWEDLREASESGAFMPRRQYADQVEGLLRDRYFERQILCTGDVWDAQALEEC